MRDKGAKRRVVADDDSSDSPAKKVPKLSKQARARKSKAAKQAAKGGWGKNPKGAKGGWDKKAGGWKKK